jgi:hypothetical protein
MPISAHKLSDYGTREEHLMELLDTWEVVLEAAQGVPTFRQSLYPNLERLLTNLPGAIEELKATLHKMPGYNEASYYRQMKELNGGRFTGKDFMQPVAPNCPIDEHEHKRGEVCRGCADLTGWKPPQES